MYALLAILVVLALGVGWARRHPSPFPPWLTPVLDNPLRRLVMAPRIVARRLDVGAGQRVLEIGPGGGLFTAELVREAAGALLVCLDLQPEMLRKVRGRLGIAAPALVCGDASVLPFSEASFDRILLVTVLGEVPDRSGALRECLRVLHPGGIVAVGESLPDPDFIPRRRLLRQAGEVGLVPHAFTGSWLGYTQSFLRPTAASAPH